MFKIKCKVVIDSALSVAGDQSRREPSFLYIFHEYQFWALYAILEHSDIFIFDSWISILVISAGLKHSKIKFKVVIDSTLVCSRGPKQKGGYLFIYIFTNILSEHYLLDLWCSKIKYKVVIDSALSVAGDQSRRESSFLNLFHEYHFWALSAILEHSSIFIFDSWISILDIICYTWTF